MEPTAVFSNALVEQMLDQAIESQVNLLYVASGHVIRAGGKRMRPRLVMLAYAAVGGSDPSQAVPVAAAMELLHTASLVHDDINDHSDLRRGRATVNARWGNSAALLAGDFLFSKVMKLACEFDVRIIRLLANTCLKIIEGETRQMLCLGDLAMDEETYLTIVREKTASLFAACTESGGILAAAPAHQIEALATYGLNLGIAFQIRDDALDCLGKPDELGKPVAADLRQKIVNLAVLQAVSKSGRFRELLLAGDIDPALELLHDMGCLEYALARAHEYAQRAKEALSTLPGSDARVELLDLADFAVSRSI
jgi:octaprenyl-diphosphate synthase